MSGRRQHLDEARFDFGDSYCGLPLYGAIGSIVGFGPAFKKPVDPVHGCAGLVYKPLESPFGIRPVKKTVERIHVARRLPNKARREHLAGVHLRTGNLQDPSSLNSYGGGARRENNLSVEPRARADCGAEWQDCGKSAR